MKTTTNETRALKTLGAGWTAEEVGHVRGLESVDCFRYNRPDGSFMRAVRFPREWVLANFAADGNATHGMAFASLKRLVESITD